MLANNDQLVDHLSKLIMHIEDNYAASHNNSQILASFEKLSVNIKANDNIDEARKIKKQFAPPKEKISAPNHIHKNRAQHLIEDNQTILHQVGFGLSESEVVFINDSLNEHKEDEGIDFEFFGKIFGSQSDYYVIYSYKDNKVENREELAKHIEKEGEGVNAFIVYVTTPNLRGQWIKLPLITPGQLRKSKKVKIVFKGDLDANINRLGFNGTEAHYLKCQLVRILSATKIVPKGIYQINEDTGKVEVNFESVKELQLNKEDALSLDNWVYLYPYLLKNGRISHFIPSHRNEEEAEELKDKLEEGDKGIERLSSIFVDEQNLWKSHTYGKIDETVSCTRDGETLQTSYNFVILKHIDWEGAYTIYSVEQQRSVFFYKGFGLKKSQVILPLTVSKIETEPKQRLEQGEPNHYEKPKDELSNDENDEIKNDDREESNDEVDE